MLETDLYEPVRKFLLEAGYEVKAEIGPADVMAVRGQEPPVIIELKTSFSLSLVHQAIERQAITDSVYVAVPAAKGRGAARTVQRYVRLCRRLGLGLISVRMRDGLVTVNCDPAPYQPRKVRHKQARLLDEFRRRTGDPNRGGTRGKVVTAYRQDAIRCAVFLSANGATKAARVAAGTGVPRARQIMADNHYGWFVRVATGIYDLDSKADEESWQIRLSE